MPLQGNSLIFKMTHQEKILVSYSSKYGMCLNGVPEYGGNWIFRWAIPVVCSVISNK